MENQRDLSWKQVKSSEDAVNLIESGVLLKWQEMRSLKKLFSDEEHANMMRQFAKSLCHSTGDRLGSEVLVESMLIWISNVTNEIYVEAFIEQIFAEPEKVQACRSFVEIALTSELSDSQHDEQMYAMAVAIVCELGIAILEYSQKHPESFEKREEVLDHITTYLLSVSNSSSTRIRLSLLHYFGYTCSLDSDKTSFNRIMNRFGHTILDYLFLGLFNKKSEGISLLYLLENLPYALLADSNSQKILHETFKFYMLKKPERFALFMQTLTEELLSKQQLHEQTYKAMLQHLGALFQVASEVNHKDLARELLLCVQKFHQYPFQLELLDHLLLNLKVRPLFRELLEKLRLTNDSTNFVDSVSQFRSPKRGRRPSFTRVEKIGTLGQVSFLGSLDLMKAS